MNFRLLSPKTMSLYKSKVKKIQCFHLVLWGVCLSVSVMAGNSTTKTLKNSGKVTYRDESD